VKTPFTPEGLRRYDDLPPVEAVVAAWTTTGRRPDWDLRVAGMIRDAAPLLARALDRLAAEHGRVPVDRPKTARLPYSTLTHAVIDTGWQLLTRCGRRVTWLTGQDDDYDPGTGVVDCPTCREP